MDLPMIIDTHVVSMDTIEYLLSYTDQQSINNKYMGQNFERCTIGSRHGVKLKFQKC